MGRKLDAEVARKIMRTIVVFEGGEIFMISPQDYVQTPIPHFSTDLNATIKILEIFQPQGWLCKITQTDCAFEVGFFKNDGVVCEIVENSALPRAICLAALAVKDGKRLP